MHSLVAMPWRLLYQRLLHKHAVPCWDEYSRSNLLVGLLVHEPVVRWLVDLSCPSGMHWSMRVAALSGRANLRCRSRVHLLQMLQQDGFNQRPRAVPPRWLSDVHALGAGLLALLRQHGLPIVQLRRHFHH